MTGSNNNNLPKKISDVNIKNYAKQFLYKIAHNQTKHIGRFHRNCLLLNLDLAIKPIPTIPRTVAIPELFSPNTFP